MKLPLVFLVVVVTGCLAGAHPNRELPSRLLPREQTIPSENTEPKMATDLEDWPTKVEQSLGISGKNISAVWVFSGDWDKTVLGKFVAGTYILIVYDASRLPGRDERYGQRAWSVFVEYKFDYETVYSDELKGPTIIEGNEIMAARVFLRFDQSKLTAWFKHWGYYSGYSYDSDYGQNYEHEIAPPEKATLVFGDYSEKKFGAPLDKGGKFKVFYSDTRLGVGDGFKLYAAAQFKDNTDVYEIHEVTDFLKFYYITTFDIPEDAEEVIMWFYTEKDYERHYDSNLGANYHFPLGV